MHIHAKYLYLNTLYCTFTCTTVVLVTGTQQQEGRIDSQEKWGKDEIKGSGGMWKMKRFCSLRIFLWALLVACISKRLLPLIMIAVA